MTLFSCPLAHILFKGTWTMSTVFFSWLCNIVGPFSSYKTWHSPLHICSPILSFSTFQFYTRHKPNHSSVRSRPRLLLCVGPSQIRVCGLVCNFGLGQAGKFEMPEILEVGLLLWWNLLVIATLGNQGWLNSAILFHLAHFILAIFFCNGRPTVMTYKLIQCFFCVMLACTSFKKGRWQF